MALNFTNLTIGTTVALLATRDLPLANDGTSSELKGGRVYIIAKDGINSKGEVAIRSYTGKIFRIKADRLIIVGHEDIMVFDGTPSYNVASGTILFAPTTAKVNNHLRTSDDAGFTTNIPLDRLIEFSTIADVIVQAPRVITSPAILPNKMESRTFFEVGDSVTCISAANSKVSLTKWRDYSVLSENTASGFINIIADSGNKAKVREDRFQHSTVQISEDIEFEDSTDECFCGNPYVENLTMKETYGLPEGATYTLGKSYKPEYSRDGYKVLIKDDCGIKFWLNSDRFLVENTSIINCNTIDEDIIFDEEEFDNENDDIISMFDIIGSTITMSSAIGLPYGADFPVYGHSVVIDVREGDTGMYEVLVEGCNGRKFWLDISRFV